MEIEPSQYFHVDVGIKHLPSFIGVIGEQSSSGMNRCFLIDVTVYNMKNCQELSLKRIELRNLNEKCVLAQSKVALLVKDSNLIQLSSKLVIEGIAFSGFAELFTFNLGSAHETEVNVR